MIHKYLAAALMSVASPIAFYSHRAKAANEEKENEVKSILKEMESDVLAFRDEIERVYTARCDNQT